MPSLIAMAVRGYIAVGVDAPCHGRRLDPGSMLGQSSSFDVGDDVDMPAEGLGHGGRATGAGLLTHSLTHYYNY